MDIEAELLGSMGEEELNQEISARIKSFYGLLTREAAIRLIAKEKGLLKKEEREYRLCEIPKGEKGITFKAKVKKVWPVATYASGKRSRVVEVEDGKCSMPLVLWNDDVELAKTLRSRDYILVKGAYEKNRELHLGYNGSLEVLSKAEFTSLANLEEGKVVHLRGFITKMEGPDSFVKGIQTIRGVSFIMTDGKTERRCIILGGFERAKKLKNGDEIIIENGIVRNGNIEVNADSRILSRRAKNLLIGKLNGLDCDGRRLIATIGNRKINLDRENALRFLGVQAAEDIALSTLVKLKKDMLINNKIALKIEQKEGQIRIG